ncbi:glycoside hydrolase family 3 C-terminal domain-containing protein [Vibrio sp. SS-MA-C1-2]|uniref:glycoside hydrolase family 3 protein n=1 Tax=Vibrio sp. SS-MA-C1-2 TaxID=2908646 RepID=UPI001F398871|nr:glycoside hydrolase family 3 protein [Vibrio sp. SS-MA-C1-2]UJF18680.1 glycoside hydrolase family 3 C-terminal domain-containing protein [Vibrio sp. SS-MA-C1-2]
MMNIRRTFLSSLVMLALASNAQANTINIDNPSNDAQMSSNGLGLGHENHPDGIPGNGQGNGFGHEKHDPASATKVPYFSDWPATRSAVPQDPAIEAMVANIVAQMTLEEKVGQMVQPDLREVTPEEAAEYKLGSLLNGGGGWPNNDKYATAEDWAKESDKYWTALKEVYADRGFDIPFMWATDAVHGHNNVFRATVFPHNIGLGAANNPDLIYEIGQATAQEIVATGLDWTFAPTVASPRDYRWGRVYEGYSEDPEIIFQYAKRMVEGLQGGAEGLKGQDHVISNVKHWVGDGGTLGGVDHGQNRYTEEYLMNIHATGYFGGLEAGAQVVMSSFNSWWNPNNYDPMVETRYLDQDTGGDYMQNQKIHGSKYLINDVLKEKMGFDGIVVTDWNGQGEINGCSASDCAQAVIAGNDVFMVTSRNDWQAFYHNVIAQVQSGEISMDRIDDAVTRILRVKARADLWNKPAPSLRKNAGDEELLGSAEHRALAREAVSQSLVLLKNNEQTLPLSSDQPYLLAGSAMDSIQKQTGGWSLTWQGDGNTIEKDFPGAETMLTALKDQVGEANVYTNMADAPEGTTAIVVIGEDPYAEMFGDISKAQTLEFSKLKGSYASDLAKIKELKEAGFNVVTVFYSGRPLYVNEELNSSDAFVAGWLPGTEAGGITDVLFGVDGRDFTGRLSYSWPKMKCSTTINRHAPNIDGYQTPIDGITGELIEQDIEGENQPLFPYGYGLSYDSQSEELASEGDLNAIPLDPRDYGCGMSEPDNGVAEFPLEIFGKDAKGEFIARMSGGANGWQDVEIGRGETTIGSVTTNGIDYQGMQQSALHVEFAGNVGEFDGNSAAQIFMQTADGKGADYNRYVNAESTLEFDIEMLSEAPESLVLSAHCEYPCMGEVKINKVLPAVDTGWTTIKVPVECLVENGMAYQMMNTPFLLFSTDAVEFNVGAVRMVPQPDGMPEDAVSCQSMRDEVAPPLMDASYDLFADFNATLDIGEQYTTEGWGPIPEGDTHLTASVDNGVVTANFAETSPENYKGFVKVKFDQQNLSEFEAAGVMQFDIFVNSLGSQKPENEQTGLVLKFANTDAETGDYFVPELSGENITTGQWTTITIPVADIVEHSGNGYFAQTFNQLNIFPAWANTQAGVSFEIKNIGFSQ